MDTIEQSKQKLKTALERLQAAIEKKFATEQGSLDKYHQLEIENNDFRATIILLKKDISELKSKLRSTHTNQEPKATTKEDDNELILQQKAIVKRKPDTKSALNEATGDNEISLDELKNIIGSKKWA